LKRYVLVLLPLSLALPACSDDKSSSDTTDALAETSTDVTAQVETEVSSEVSSEVSPDAETDVTNAPVALDDLTATTAAAICPLMFDCPTLSTSDDDAFVRAFLIDKTRCPTRLEPVLAGTLRQLLRRVDAGTLRYDPVAAGACTAGWSCSDMVGSDQDWFYEGRCADVFAGTVSAGGDCQQSADCQGVDMACSFDGATCPGTCKTAGTLGAPCDYPDECSSENGTLRVVCDSSCREERIADPAAAGGACGMLDGATIVLTPCAAGNHCVIPEASAVGTCTKDIAAGAPCQENPGCVVGLICLEGSCVPLPLSTQVGDPCTSPNAESGLRLCDPAAGLACDSGARTCVAAGAGAVGSPCRDFVFLESCGPDAWCDDTQNVPTCAALKALADTCMGSSECASGECDYATGKCAASACRAL